MASPPRQLTLELPLEPSYREDDFLIASSNNAAYATIMRWPHWLGRRLIIAGPPGSGKSHLAAIWAQRSGARVLRASALQAAEAPALAQAAALVIEDADLPPHQEAALFHLLNLAEERGAFVLLTAKTAPDRWGLTTPDLLSRLRLAPLCELGAPDVALVRDVFVKLFADRQLAVEPALVGGLARHVERSLGTARALAERLDREALAQGKRITRAMAAGILALDAEGAEDAEDAE